MIDPDQLTKSQRANLKRRQHCTPEDYAKVFLDQSGNCACCGNPPELPSTHLRADTFRKDGQIALICQPCFDVLEVLAKRSSQFLTYLEASQIRK